MNTPSPDSWRQISHELMRLEPFDVLHHRHIHIEPPSGGTIADLAKLPKQFLRLGEPYAKEIDAAIDEWTRGKPLTLPSDEHKVYFLYRVVAAGRFARLHTMIGRIVDKTVLPDPSCSTQIAVSYLLKEWWYERGYREYYYTAKEGSRLLQGGDSTS